MDSSTVTLGLVGLGVFLAWSALANKNPLDEFRATFDKKREVRALSTGAGRTVMPTPDTGGGGLASALKKGAGGPGWPAIVAYLKRVGINPKVGSTTGGQHTSGSKHYDGLAVDFPGNAGSGPDPELDRIYNALVRFARGPDAIITELYYRDKGWDDGKWIGKVGGHDGHVHAAIRQGATL